ncbi:DUF1566 domain-containing protein [Elusimicrobiota bacterium]
MNRTTNATIWALSSLLFLGAGVQAGDFVDNGDGTVTDTKNKLMWQKEAYCQESEVGSMNWKEAVSFGKKLSFAGHDDWRLSSKKDMATLFAIFETGDDEFFSGFLDEYGGGNQFWTSTDYPKDPKKAWGFRFYGGDAGFYRWASKYSFCCRYVRSAKSARKRSSKSRRRARGGERFVTDETGTVLDTKTDLMWMEQDFYQIMGRPCRGYKEALGYLEKMNRTGFGGYSDWRLPDFYKEWKTVYIEKNRVEGFAGTDQEYLRIPKAFAEGGGYFFYTSTFIGDDQLALYNSSTGDAIVAGVGGLGGHGTSARLVRSHDGAASARKKVAARPKKAAARRKKAAPRRKKAAKTPALDALRRAAGRPAPAGKEEVVFSNRNKGTVWNLPVPTFQLSQPMVITKINTYHWNGGKGTKEPGRIGIRGVGSWQAEGAPGMANTPNAEWTAHPNVKLEAGEYAVTDSDPSSWSQNIASKGLGFVEVYGKPMKAAPAGRRPPVLRVEGTWDTNWQELVLEQDGRRVHGNYGEDNGEVFGEMSGKVLTGYWVEDDSGERCDDSKRGRHYWGKVKMKFDRGRFIAEWGYCDGELDRSDWDGALTKAASRPARKKAPVVPAFSVAGKWSTNWQDMALEQDGDRVTGTYEEDNGEVLGTLSGKVLTGYWIEDHSGEECSETKNGRSYWGRMKMTFTGGKFSAMWSYCDAKPVDGDWSGTRK